MTVKYVPHAYFLIIVLSPSHFLDQRVVGSNRYKESGRIWPDHDFPSNLEVFCMYIHILHADKRMVICGRVT